MKLATGLVVIAALLVTSCSKEVETNRSFEGVWRNSGKISQTLTIEKTGNDFRVRSEYEDPDWKGFNLETKLIAESPTLLVQADGKRALELVDQHTVKSYLRKKAESFTK